MGFYNSQGVIAEHHDPWTGEAKRHGSSDRGSSWPSHESLATTQKYLEPSKETEKQLEAMKLPF